MLTHQSEIGTAGFCDFTQGQCLFGSIKNIHDLNSAMTGEPTNKFFQSTRKIRSRHDGTHYITKIGHSYVRTNVGMSESYRELKLRFAKLRGVI